MSSGFRQIVPSGWALPQRLGMVRMRSFGSGRRRWRHQSCQLASRRANWVAACWRYQWLRAAAIAFSSVCGLRISK